MNIQSDLRDQASNSEKPLSQKQKIKLKLPLKYQAQEIFKNTGKTKQTPKVTASSTTKAACKKISKAQVQGLLTLLNSKKINLHQKTLTLQSVEN